MLCKTGKSSGHLALAPLCRQHPIGQRASSSISILWLRLSHQVCPRDQARATAVSLHAHGRQVEPGMAMEFLSRSDVHPAHSAVATVDVSGGLLMKAKGKVPKGSAISISSTELRLATVCHKMPEWSAVKRLRYKGSWRNQRRDAKFCALNWHSLSRHHGAAHNHQALTA